MASAHARQALTARTKTPAAGRGAARRRPQRPARHAVQQSPARPPSAPLFSLGRPRDPRATTPSPARRARERAERERDDALRATGGARGGGGGQRNTTRKHQPARVLGAHGGQPCGGARALSSPAPARARASSQVGGAHALSRPLRAAGGQEARVCWGKWGALLCIHAPCGAPRARRRPWGRRAAPLRHEGCMCDPCDKCERARGRRRRSKGRPQERLLVCRIEVCTRGCPRRPARW